jgi:nickel transport protein
VRGFWRGIVLTVAVSVSGTAYAHEFIAKPGAMTVPAGAELQVAGLSSHIFLISQELEAAKDVKVGFYVGGKRTDIAVKPNEKTMAYDGTVTAPSNGTFVVTGARLPQIWATTPQGLKQIIRKTPDASNPYKIEKFSKALVNVTPADNGFSTVIGDTLEIVPLTNPATVKPGDELTVKVLFKGQPLTTNVYATYDGFSKEENTYAYYTEGHKDGTAKVKITQPGIWMVRVQHTAPEHTEDYDRYVARAVLRFEVK